MSRINRASSKAIKEADKVAIIYYPENVPEYQYGVAAYNIDTDQVTVASDGSGLVMLYAFRSKAMDAIRRLNPSYNATNIPTVEAKEGFMGYKTFFKSY